MVRETKEVLWVVIGTTREGSGFIKRQPEQMGVSEGSHTDTVAICSLTCRAAGKDATVYRGDSLLGLQGGGRQLCLQGGQDLQSAVH